MKIFAALKRDKTFSQPVNWGVTAMMIALHLCALGAIFFFTWKALIVCIVMWWVAGSLGIGMGYHRLLTHRGYKTPKWMEYFLTTCGTLAFEGGPIAWVATHRIHHQNTDKEGDPHSPRDGGIWSHMGWILTGRAMHRDRSELLPYVPDLRKDKFHLWISKWHVVPSVVVAVIFYAIGGWPWVFWGVFVRSVMSLHFTWLVNSATHIWGSQRFETGRHVHEQFLGGDPDVRRGLAQQSSRAPAGSAPWVHLVRSGHELVRNLDAANAGTRVGHQDAQARSGIRWQPTGCVITN